MDLVYDIINNQFGLLLVITLIVFGGFTLYLLYIFNRMRKFQKELESLKKLE